MDYLTEPLGKGSEPLRKRARASSRSARASSKRARASSKRYRSFFEKTPSFFEKVVSLFKKVQGLSEKVRGLFEKLRSLFENLQSLLESSQQHRQEVCAMPHSIRQRLHNPAGTTGRCGTDTLVCAVHLAMTETDADAEVSAIQNERSPARSDCRDRHHFDRQFGVDLYTRLGMPSCLPRHRARLLRSLSRHTHR